MSGSEFDPFTREELIEKTKKKKTALQIHKEKKAKDKAKKLYDENQARILRNARREISIARKKREYEEEIARIEAHNLKVKEQQRQIERGEIVKRPYTVDKQISEFGEARTQVGLVTSADDRVVALEYEPRGALARTYKPDTRSMREEFGTGYGVEGIKKQVERFLAVEDRRKFDEFEGRKIPFTPKMKKKVEDFGTELGIELELSKEYGAGLAPTWVKQTFDLEEYSEKEYELPLNELLPKPIEVDLDAHYSFVFQAKKFSEQAEARHSQYGTKQEALKERLLQKNRFSDEYVLAMASGLDTKAIDSQFLVGEYEALKPMYRPTTSLEAKWLSTLRYLPPKMATGISMLPGVVADPQAAIDAALGYKVKREVVYREGDIITGQKGYQVSKEVGEGPAFEIVTGDTYGEEVSEPYAEIAQSIKESDISDIGSATLKKDMIYFESREGGMTDQMHKSYKEDKEQFAIDVALSLVLFTGVTSALSKAGQIGRGLSGATIIAVQPIEQFATFGLTKMMPSFVKKYGTPDWEEQVIRIGKGKLTGKAKKTAIRVELEAEEQLRAVAVAEIDAEYKAQGDIEVEAEVEAEKIKEVETKELMAVEVEVEVEERLIAEVEVEAERKGEVQVEAEVEVEAERKGEVQVEAEVEAEAEVEVEVEAEVEVEVEVEVEAEVEVEVEAEVEVEVEVELFEIPWPEEPKYKDGKKFEVGNFETWSKELNFEVGDLNKELSKIDKDLNKLMKKL